MDALKALSSKVFQRKGEGIWSKVKWKKGQSGERGKAINTVIWIFLNGELYGFFLTVNAYIYTDDCVFVD